MGGRDAADVLLCHPEYFLENPSAQLLHDFFLEPLTPNPTKQGSAVVTPVSGRPRSPRYLSLTRTHTHTFSVSLSFVCSHSKPEY